MSADQPTPTLGTARIHEQGYRRYEGVRLGPRNAVRSVFLHTLRFILGAKRKFRSKVLPVGVFALATLPAIGFGAMLLLLPDFAADIATEVLPGPESYLGGTIFLVYIAAAVAGPAALCGDRLHGSLALYLASPLTRRTYLLGKAMAVLAVVMALTVLPSVIYVTGVALSGVQGHSTLAVMTDVLQAILAGSFVAVGYAALAMAAAAMTDRQGAASGLIIGFAMVSTFLRGILVHALGLPDWASIVDVNTTFGSAAFHLHAKGAEFAAVSAPVAYVGSLAWIALFVAIVVVRYDRLQVTR